MLPLLLNLLLMPQLVDSTKRVEPTGAVALTPEKRADIFMARKMYREASETYLTALNSDPRSARLYNKLGISYHQQNQLDQARRNYERAFQTDEDYSQAINNLGTIYYAQGKYKRAQKTYQKALKADPDSASIYSNLATAYFMRGKYKQASQHYLTALELDPEVFERKGESGTLMQERSVADRAKYYYYLATAYAHNEQWDRALLYLRKSLEEGYGNTRKILSDKNFEPMHEMPAFQSLVAPQATNAPAAD